jgi:hypothetical protein
MGDRVDLCATLPLKGRDTQAEHVKKRPKTTFQIRDFPPVELVAPPITIHRTNIPGRPNSASGKHSKAGDRLSKMSSSYAVKFGDGTWGHSDLTTKDRPITRDDVNNLGYKFEQNLELIAGFKGAELARRIQACTDLLLDELVTQLRVMNLGQAELLEKMRFNYARVFELLNEDSVRSRQEILELEERTRLAEEERARTIEGAKLRIAEVEEDCRVKLKKAQDDLDQKMHEYDESMRRFLEQKSQLEGHVKALHHVFLDFQRDSAYLTLENMKEEVAKANARTEVKTQEMLNLQIALTKWKDKHQEMEQDRNELEGVITGLRNQLKDALEKNVKLRRQCDLLRMNLEDAKQYVPSRTNSETFDIPRAPMFHNEPDANSPFGSRRRRRVSSRATVKVTSDNIWLVTYQNLAAIGSSLRDFIEKMTNKPVLWNDDNDDHNEMILLSKDSEKVERVISQKVDQVVMVADCLNQLSAREGGQREEFEATGACRFLQFFERGIAGAVPSLQSNANIYAEVRRIWQAKYLSDKWNKRAGRPLTRFPEFVVIYFFKDDNKISSALHFCEKLWKNLKKVKAPEVKLFRKFLKERYTLDELAFFLELRFGLLGVPAILTTEPAEIKVPHQQCKELMTRTLGAFSPIASIVGDEAEKLLDQNKMINYAVFLDLFMKFYSAEREKRKTAVKLMYNSQKMAGGSETPIVLEVFVTMLQSLGFRGSVEQVMEFYQVARLLSGGDVSLQGMYRAMDQLAIHFYSIDIPMESDISFERSEESRNMVLAHWAKFGQWFDGLRKAPGALDTWVRAQLALQVRRVEQSFQLNLPAATLYAEYRLLIDSFQFFLNLLARGAPISMPVEDSEQQIELMEALNELLLAFILRAGTQKPQGGRPPRPSF